MSLNVGDRKTCSRNLIRSTKEGLVDANDSVSSCPSSSSDSDAEDRVRFRRLKYTIPPERELTDCPTMLILHHKTNPEKSVVVVKDFMSESRIEKLRTLFRSSDSGYEIKDRKADLYHAHRAFRVEVALRLGYPKVYRKLMRTSLSVCDEVWGDIRSKNIRRNRVIPELEYIVYDAPRADSQGTFIEPHVDNHSIVTGIIMLSKRGTDFEGGVNRFKGSQSETSEQTFREYALEQGDLVLFRGELVTHWITPVTRGIREILQWELSRI